MNSAALYIDVDFSKLTAWEADQVRTRTKAKADCYTPHKGQMGRVLHPISMREIGFWGFR